MGGTARTLSYQYDRDGDRTRITHPDGVAFNTLYDGLDRPSWIQDSNAAVNYSYRAWGSSAGYGRFGGASGRYLSPDGRLTIVNQYNGPSGALDASWTFTHNPAGQAATQVLSNDLFAYTGHANGNTAYVANGLNQHATVAGAAVTYDKNGNLTGDPGAVTGAASAVTLVYDIENRLVSASGGRNASLVYDPLGRLSSLTAGGNTTRFLYDGDALVAEYDGAGTLQHRYVHGVGADVPLMQYDGATVSIATRRYLLADARGSIVAITDGSSLVQNRNSYDEYGVPAAANAGRFQYTGQIWLPELGLFHYKARMYSPYVGTFPQTDPIGYGDQYNLYAYVGNDPVNHTDPTGEQDLLGAFIDPVQYPPPTAQDWAAVGRAVLEVAGNALEAAGDVMMSLPEGHLAAEPIGRLGGFLRGLGRGSEGERAAVEAGRTTLQPGPFAGRGIPARGPARDFTAAERAAVNREMAEHGCHTCGTRQPGTRSGNAIPDHQPPNALNSSGGRQRLYPHCSTCSRRQAGQVTQEVMRRRRLKEAGE